MATLLTNWNWMRWVRLGLAIAFLMAGFNNGDGVAYVAAAFFGIQAIFNVGCCGADCSASEHTTLPKDGTNVAYEEVK